MNRLRHIITVLVVSFSAVSTAQENHPDYDAVMGVVNQFFEAINTGNAELMSSIMIDGSVNYSIRENNENEFSVRQRQEDNATREAIPEVFTERYWDHKVLIDDHIAVFWAPYDFYVDGEFSHCGIDSLDLIKVEGTWKMANTMYTVVRTDCPPSPLGEL